MHPIERLRFVARSSGADQALLVRETAGALAAFDGDPAGMVTACRRVISRHPGSGPLWWLCARVLTATEPMHTAWEASDEIDADPTPAAVARAIPEDATVCVLGWPELVSDALPRRGDLDLLVVDSLGEGAGLVRRLQRADVACEEVPVSGVGGAASTAELVLLEASAIGPTAALAVAGSRAAAAVAHHAGIPVWLVGGVGRLVPQRVWEQMLSRIDAAAEPWDRDDDEVPLSLVDAVVGPDGPQPVPDALRRTDCPIAPELFRMPPDVARG